MLPKFTKAIFVVGENIFYKILKWCYKKEN